jgi:predicted nucleotidyltransferase
MTRDETIAALQRAFPRTRGVRLGLLFRSMARDTANEDSDVDVAVELDAGADVLDIAAELSREVGCEVHVLELSDPGVPLLEELVRDAITIYEATPYAATRWRGRALIDLDTDGPRYARMRDAWLKRVAERGLGDGRS